MLRFTPAFFPKRTLSDEFQTIRRERPPCIVFLPLLTRGLVDLDHLEHNLDRLQIAVHGLVELATQDHVACTGETGEYSCTGTCFDIGMTTCSALQRFKRTGQPFAGSTDPRSAGNGSLMRLAPVAIHHWNDRATLRDVAVRQSRTTHGAPEAVDACVAFAEVLADAIAGYPRSQVLRVRDYPYAGRIGEIMAGSWRRKRRSEIDSSGYVAHSLEAALWCVGRTSSFADAVLLAANLGGDADTTAAITGQLAGALYGAGGIPDKWLDKLAWRERIVAMLGELPIVTAVQE